MEITTLGFQKHINEILGLYLTKTWEKYFKNRIIELKEFIDNYTALDKSDKICATLEMIMIYKKLENAGI
jgi:hypothetical protein